MKPLGPIFILLLNSLSGVLNCYGQDLEKTFSGLQYAVLQEGDGEQAYNNRRVTIAYLGSFQNGQVFDSSSAEGFTFVLGRGQVVSGMDEGIRLMTVGSTYRFVIPPKLAYGKKGIPGRIPPNETLIFEVTLLQVEDL